MMARLYADEQFPRPVVEHLRNLGHDVLTVQEAGNAGDSDPEVRNYSARPLSEKSKALHPKSLSPGERDFDLAPLLPREKGLGDEGQSSFELKPE